MDFQKYYRNQYSWIFKDLLSSRFENEKNVYLGNSQHQHMHCFEDLVDFLTFEVGDFSNAKIVNFERTIKTKNHEFSSPTSVHFLRANNRGFLVASIMDLWRPLIVISKRGLFKKNV